MFNIPPLKNLTDIHLAPITERNPNPRIYTKWIWPNHLSSLGIDSEEQEICSAVILSIYSDMMKKVLEVKEGVLNPPMNFKAKKNEEFLLDNDRKILPLSIRFLQDGQIILSPKRVSLVGKGAQTKVKKIWNLCTGKWEAKKHLIHPYQMGIYQRIRHQKGCAQYHDFIIGAKTIKVLQPLYHCNLESLLLKKQLSHTQKLVIFRSLLAGLAHLHSIPYHYSDGNSLHCGVFNHGDIKLKNILIRLSPHGTLEVGIDDFGLSGRWNSLTYSQGCESPELCLVWLKLRKHLTKENRRELELQIINHNQLLSHMQDVWAMGLVLASVLMGELVTSPHYKSRSYFPNLNFLTSKLNAEPVKQKYGIYNIDQMEIDEEIRQKMSDLPRTKEGSETLMMWQIILGMLQKDPRCRLKSHRASQLAELTGGKIPNRPSQLQCSVNAKRIEKPIPFQRDEAKRSRLVKSA